MELFEFLAAAKKNAYVSETSVYDNYEILEDGCRQCVFSRGDYLYRDRYFGYSSFIGEEMVFLKGTAVWSMNYYGELLNDDVSCDDVYNFLGSALFQVTANSPFRGPKMFSKGAHVYLNHIKGEAGKFMGEESILFDGEKVYGLYYHGGYIK